MDVHDKAQRSFNMSRIRDKNTKPELAVRKTCHGLGFRFRLHRNDLPGRPDLAFPRSKTALFVHGCFWHSHDCRWGLVAPKTNSDFWAEKRRQTVERDKRNICDLYDRGWRSCVIWECETRDQDLLTERLLQMLPQKRSGSTGCSVGDCAVMENLS